MKKLFLYSLIGMMVAFGCTPKERESQCAEWREQAVKVFETPHELRKMANYISQEGRISGSFFLFFGNMSGSSSSTLEISFAWKHPNGKYFNTSLPIEKILVELTESIITPVVYFDYDRSPGKYEGRLDLGSNPLLLWPLDNPLGVNNLINSATIICSPNQWTFDVQLPYQSNSNKD